MIPQRLKDWWQGKPRVGRSPKWPAMRRTWLLFHPACAVCGSKKNVVPHHVIPVHVDPSLELSARNLVSLCEGSVFNCHLFFGHLGAWTSWNPSVQFDSHIWASRRANRPVKG